MRPIHVVFRTVTCCIYSSKDRTPKQNSALYVYPDIQQGQVVSGDTTFDLSKQRRQGCLSHVEWKQGHKTRLPLTPSTTQEMISRFPHHVEFGVGYGLNVVVNENQYAITEIFVEAMYPCPERLKLVRFNSDEEKEKSGVALLHYFSELQHFETE